MISATFLLLPLMLLKKSMVLFIIKVAVIFIIIATVSSLIGRFSYVSNRREFFIVRNAGAGALLINIVAIYFAFFIQVDPKYFTQKKLHSNETFKQQVLLPFCDIFPPDSAKNQYLTTSLDFLNNRYSEAYLYEGFYFDRFDSTELLLNMYFAMHQEIDYDQRMAIRNENPSPQTLMQMLESPPSD